MDWGKYYIGVSTHPLKMFIGTGRLRSDGIIKYTNRSDDKSYEIISAVAKYMRLMLDSREKKESKKKRKHYFGYDIPRCGKLVLIPPKYDFKVFRKQYNTPEQPIQDY